VILLLFLFPFHLVASAQKGGSNNEFGLGSGEIKITADNLIANSKENSAEFSGNVKAVQKDTVITSDRLKIFFKSGTDNNKENPDPDALQKIVITGNVEIKFDKRVAVTQEAVYITQGKRLVLKGPNTKITSGKDTITGEKITLFRDTGRVQVEGSRANRVEAIIYPGEKKEE
jgi:lipopolysaccharide export system protein LptA